MITFKIKPFRDQELAFHALNDMIADGRKEYKNTMIGPYEDLTLEFFGIIIDGDNEKALSDDFEKIVKRKYKEYTRTDQPGVLFYEAREW